MRSLPFAAIFFTSSVVAQWQPEGVLAEIRQVDDCTLAGQDLAHGSYTADGSYVIHTCGTAMAELERSHPGASHFFLVRAYTFRAMGVDSEEAGDVWAAAAVAQSPNAAYYLNAALSYLKTGPRFDRIRDAAAETARLAGIALTWNAATAMFE
jgi:hypothetical protein